MHSATPGDDSSLIQIVEAAWADASQRSGAWLVCRAGCAQCCIGPFAINQLDVDRLHRGMRELDERSPAKAERIRRRASESVARMTADYPGDVTTGLLDEGAEGDAWFAEWGNDEPCPVLDPETGRCDLYAHRPMTCRVFGPPLRSDEGLGACELCYHGATDEEIAACEIKPPDNLEAELNEKLEDATGRRGETIVAFCLRQ